MSAANQTQAVRFVVPTLVGSTRYTSGVHQLPTDLAAQLLQAGDAVLPDADQDEAAEATAGAADAAAPATAGGKKGGKK